MKDINEAFLDPDVIGRNPFLADALLISEGGKRLISQVTPSFVHNTIDNPIFPNQGKRYTLGIDLAGLGGNTNFIKPRAEACSGGRSPGRRRWACGPSSDYIRPTGARSRCRSTSGCSWAASTASAATTSAPSARATSARREQPGTFIVLGGNKSALFNAEYQFALMSQLSDHGLLRCRPGQGLGRPDELGRLRDVHRRRGPVLHAGA